MKIDKRYRESLRKIYYDNIIKMPELEHDQIITETMRNVRDTFHFSEVGLYEYDEWKKTYTRINNPIDERKHRLPLHLKYFPSRTEIKAHLENNSCWEDSIFKDETTDVACILRLNYIESTNYFLIIVHDDKKYLQCDQTVEAIKSETEYFFRIVKEFYDMKVNNHYSRFFNDFSSRLTSTNIQSVIRKIVNELQSYYPNFEHQFFLSQDFEMDDTLPVNLIEFNDQQTDSLLTQSFMSGEIQVEIKQSEEDKQYFIYAPLIGNQAIYGVIQIKTTYLIDFLDKTLKFLLQFVKIAGRAIENATLYRSSKNLVSDLKFINDVTHELNANHKLSDLLNIIKTKIVAVSDASEVGFIYYEDANLESKFQILSESTSYFNLMEGKSITKHVYNQFKMKPEPIFSGNFTRQYDWIPFESVMILPMKEAGKIYGFTMIMHEAPFYFTFEKFKLMQSLIQHSTLAIINTILKDKLETAVITDHLTKLYARNYLDDMITMHMKLDEKGTLILFDIDDFKNINDMYGHAVGDEVLIQVAHIIKQSIRADDVPARWGGEEFAIYLPHVDLNGAMIIAERIRKQVKKCTEPKITISCGISTWMNRENDSVNRLFVRADQALYRAKQLGKNRIVKESYEKN